VSFDDPGMNARLAEVFEKANGAAVIELTGSPSVWDSILENLQMWGRILAAGPASSQLTIDFYNNVHRKSVTIKGAQSIDSDLAWTGSADADAGSTQRAVSLLTGPCANRFEHLYSYLKLSDA